LPALKTLLTIELAANKRHEAKSRAKEISVAENENPASTLTEGSGFRKSNVMVLRHLYFFNEIALVLFVKCKPAFGATVRGGARGCFRHVVPCERHSGW